MIEIAAERLPAASFCSLQPLFIRRLSRRARDAASVSVETITLIKSGQRKCFSGRHEELTEGVKL